ncbi:MAG: NERD domain-containing protein [Polyangiaceae bacterium]
MNLRRAITLAKGGPLASAARRVLELLERELSGWFPLASSIRLFAPPDAPFEIDLLILGHYGLYLVDVKGWISADKRAPRGSGPEPQHVATSLALARRHARALAMLLKQELGPTHPSVEAVIVVPDPGIELDLPPATRSHVLTSRELLHTLQFGDLPGEPIPPGREPVDEATAASVQRIFRAIRALPEPGRGRLRDEMPLLSRDLALDLRGRSAQPDIDGALWCISCAFIRALEEQGMVGANRLAGEGSAEAEISFRTLFPDLGPSHYLVSILRGVADHTLGQAVLGEILDRLGAETLSHEAAAAVLAFFRQVGPAGKLRWRFAGDPWTDLYENVSGAQREDHGMLATPGFVNALLLDRTLEPALNEMGVDSTRVLDPACGSGLLLLAAFERLFERLRAAAPGEGAAEIARKALDRIHGADISPVATLVTRIRLMLAYIDRASSGSLSGAGRPPPLHIETVDSLADSEVGSPDILQRRYEAVLCEPPSATCKDAGRRKLYRSRYRSAAGKFSLTAPFIERCIELAAEDGFIGIFSSSPFMKREFGKPLVEEVLPPVDVTCVIDASRAYIPGHATPTLLLFARNRRPRSASVRVVGARCSEPMQPHDPAKGEVWSAILAHLDDDEYEDEYIAVGDLPRSVLAKHPWSFVVGRERQITEAIELSSERRLNEVVAAIRGSARSGCDEIFVLPPEVPVRLGIEREVVRASLSSSSIRDWAAATPTAAITPYGPDEREPLPAAPGARWWRFLWRYRTRLEDRSTSYLDSIQPWWAWMAWPSRPPRGAPRLLHAAVGRMNDFAFDRGDAVLRTGLCIEMPEQASDDDCFALLGYLNSSTACYWLKLASHRTGTFGGGARPEDELFDFATRDIPVPRAVLEPGRIRSCLIALARQLDSSARQRAACAPERVLAGWDRVSGDALIEALGDAQMRDLAILRTMVFDQEALDWLIYEALGLVDGAPSKAAGSALPEHRPFAWLSDEPPAGLDRRLIEPWKRRRALTRAHPLIEVLEHRRYKRPFQVAGALRPMRVEDLEQRLAASCEEWLLDRIEDVFRGLDDACALDVSGIAARLETAAGTREVIWLLRGPANDAPLEPTILDLLESNAVSFHASFRHTAVGQAKRAEWEHTWELQRREDAGEPVCPEVAPSYDRIDYRDAVTWRHRGRLDVPTERFIRYPGAAPDGLTALYGWAGWEVEQRFSVLAALYEERQNRDEWEEERLAPFLAGIRELVNEAPEAEPPWAIVAPVMPLEAGGLRDAGGTSEVVARERKRKDRRDRA